MVTRRRFLTGAAASGAVLFATPRGAMAKVLGTAAEPGAARESRLAPGRFLVHADLHNHTLFSDGDGDPAEAFARLRANGLDVAALTDHAVLGGPLGLGLSVCGDGCTSVRGIDDASWAEAGQLADGADDPGAFTAIRGFEWSSPTLGHMNVWFGDDWVDPERTLGLVGIEGVPGLVHQEVPELGPVLGPLEDLLGGIPPVTGLMMRPFYEWLARAPGTGNLGGGSDALASFNHPGREPGRFGRFHFDARLNDRVVGLELFNRDEDYLFEGTDRGQPSPLVECLDNGWTPGLLGVTDEHGTDWGAPLDKGRAGLWVTELSRAGVHEALRARRFFATRERGLRVDATIGGAPMGARLGHAGGPVEVALDVDGGPSWIGRALVVQVLRPGGSMPTIAAEVDVVVPGPTDPVITFSVPVDAGDGSWIVLRLLDPDGPPDGRATGAYDRGRAIAYVSPVHLDPDLAASAPVTGLAATGAGGGGSTDVRALADVAPVPTGSRLPATGGLSSRTALVGGLALGASLAGAAVTRRVGQPDHGHAHPHAHSHGGTVHTHADGEAHHHH